MEVNIRSVPVLWSYSYLFKSADCFPVFELMLALIGKRLPDSFFSLKDVGTHPWTLFLSIAASNMFSYFAFVRNTFVRANLSSN